MTGPPGGELVIVDADVDGRRCDVVMARGAVRSVRPAGSARRGSGAGATGVVAAGGGALLPGLHDHHVHLVATAAARASIDVGPPAVTTRDGFAAVLAAADRAAPPAAWLRAVNAHESVVGELDRDVLDRVVPSRPTRVQHRSGAAWFVNSAALAALGVGSIPADDDPSGIERSDDGRPTGRLFRADAWLRGRLHGELPDLRSVGEELAAAGVVGCTDATPWPSTADYGRFATAAAQLPQRVVGMVAPGVEPGAATVPVVAVKVVLGDHDLPGVDAVADQFAVAHRGRRPVAVHSVTAASLALAIAAWQDVGAHPGDRVEHAAEVPAAAVGILAGLGVRVVTQPGLVGTRGDSYLDETPAGEHGDLWRCGSLLAAGIPVAAGSDAPQGPLDPWAAIRSAVERRAPSGRVLGADEAVDAQAALDLWLSPFDDPGGPARRVVDGAPADLCLLDRPLAEALRAPSSDHVVTTVIGGTVVYGR